jgi:predicted metalloprotease with PDZ domain
MNKVSWFVKVSGIAALATLIAMGSFSGGVAHNTFAAQATAAATKAATKAPEIKATDLCTEPPTPTPTKAAAPVATQAATKAAPTTVPTKAPPTVVPTKAPPTATPTAIPKGKEPAWPGVTLVLDKKFTRGGQPCVRVDNVVAGGPFAAAGVKRGDYVLAVGTVVVKALPDVFLEVAKKKSGDVIEVTVQQTGKANKVRVTLGLNPNAGSAVIATVAATPAK